MGRPIEQKQQVFSLRVLSKVKKIKIVNLKELTQASLIII